MTGSKKTLAADVLVLGGGMAGLCAALSAAEKGARVLVLEKGTRLGARWRCRTTSWWSRCPPAWTGQQAAA